MRELLDSIDKLNEIGIALSAEDDAGRLLERILLGARSLTHADGGTLYLLDEERRQLRFAVVVNESLQLHMGGGDEAIPFPPIPLERDGRPNYSAVVTSAVLTDRTINLADIHESQDYDFSGARAFDRQTGYRTRSLLTVPMKNHEHDVIGVLQLVNAVDPRSGEVRPFSGLDEQLAESLASQAAVALTQKRLIEDLQRLFESFIQLIASAIDEKSPYTGGHCRRIPVLTLMLADAAHRAGGGPLEGFRMSEQDRYALEIAGWLHDCGKITTPEFVIDKATKLQTIFDRIELVETRFELLRRDAEIALLRRRLDARAGADVLAEAEAEHQATLRALEGELEFLRHVNIGSELMAEEDRRRVQRIGRRRWTDRHGRRRELLTPDEAHNLSIPRGTLTEEEREVVNHHIVASIRMLESLPFPKHLRNVPEYAAGHHERMDGTGYPRGLVGEQMSVQARIMAIADIFEALSARDRPYKRGKTLSECLAIMGRMRLDNHIDPDLFDLFVEERIYLAYAREFLEPEQIDAVDHGRIPGFRPPRGPG